MDRYIGAELDRRYQEYLAHPQSPPSKSVMDLVLHAHVSSLSLKTSSLPAKLDPSFRAFAIRQIRLFIFAGHDSTSAAICYCFYVLSQHPEALERLREEHDLVLGPDPAAATTVISTNPRIVNNLPYTLAVIKETLRLFPPAGTTRAGKPGVSVSDDTGMRCPTDDAIIWVLHVEAHRSPQYWVRPDDFLPERWLVGPEHELYPRPGTWRPFEHGPRNCIAQALVLVELRVILACMAREFNILPAYDELDETDATGKVRTCRGERAYLVGEGAAHPAARFPCYIEVTERRRHE
jgi:cytochrome P450